MEGLVGIGAMVSPVLGIYTYLATGFATTFYIFGAIMVPTAILSLCLPSPKKYRNRLAAAKLEGKIGAEEKLKEDDENKSESNETSENSNTRLTYGALIKDRRILFVALGALV